MGKFILFNHKIVPKRQALIPLDNRGTLYGDGLFETMRCKGTIVPFFELHWQRLSQGMGLLHLQDESFTKQRLKAAIQRIVHKEKFFGACSVRVNIVRKPGGKYTPAASGIDFFMEAFALEHESFTLNEVGLKIGLYTEVPKPLSPLSALKHSNALPQVLAGLYAKSNGLDECLLLNTYGHIVESVSSNVFFVLDGAIVTPAVECGCVNGTLRKVMVDLIPQCRIKLYEADSITPEILDDAEEVFLTNAVAGIRRVVAYGKKRYFFKTSQMLLEHLNSHYSQLHLEESLTKD